MTYRRFFFFDCSLFTFDLVGRGSSTSIPAKKFNGKERTIKEEIFDKSSDRIARLVNKIWLCRYPRCRYLIYDNGSEFKLHFETLCDSYGIKRKPTTIKNPQGNAINHPEEPGGGSPRDPRYSLHKREDHAPVLPLLHLPDPPLDPPPT